MHVPWPEHPLGHGEPPRKALGRTAVDMIMDLLSRPSATVPVRNHVVLQPELVVRESA